VGNNEYYENVLRIITFLNNKELKALPITNEKWYEIDDKQDLDIAEALFAEEQDILRKYYGRFGGYWRFPRMLDFCYLVNPYFRTSKIIDEMQANFRTLVAEYPSGMKVNTLLASKCWGIREDYIVPGNGAAELIKAMMELLPGTLGVTRPTFEEYPNRREKDSLVTFVPRNNEYRYSAQELMDFFGENPADNILLINPDNPSGNFIPLEDICVLASWCEKRGIRLIVDESFVDFSVDWENNTLLHDNILESYPHMLVVKSISKSYGVPGIRLGILCSADVEIVSRIKKMLSIWNINSFCEFFMQIYTKYEKDYKRACEKFIVARDEFEKKLRRINYLRVIPSQANYFLVEVLKPYTANELVLKMLKEFNILMRDCSGKEGFDGRQYMRIAVRDSSDNDRLIDALKKLEK
jgi:histidinol-phosphate/aromatic aminotransferase/cobyric acid decarboxylase-like protein